MDCDDECSTAQKKLMEKMYFLNVQYRESTNAAEKFKQRCEVLEKELNDIKPLKELLEESVDKLQSLMEVNEALEVENDKLNANVADLSKKIEKHHEEASDMNKKIVKLKFDKEDLKQKYKKAKDDEIDGLKRKLIQLEDEKEEAEQKASKAVQEYQRLLDENVELKLDLQEKSNENSQLANKLKNLEPKRTTHENTNRQMAIANSRQGPQDQIAIMNYNMNYFNQMYAALRQERDALNTQLIACQAHYGHIMNSQQQEIRQFKQLFEEANSKLWDLKSAQKIEEINENYMRLQKEFNELRANMNSKGNQLSSIANYP